MYYVVVGQSPHITDTHASPRRYPASSRTLKMLTTFVYRVYGSSNSCVSGVCFSHPTYPVHSGSLPCFPVKRNKMRKRLGLGVQSSNYVSWTIQGHTNKHTHRLFLIDHRLSTAFCSPRSFCLYRLLYRPVRLRIDYSRWKHKKTRNDALSCDRHLSPILGPTPALSICANVTKC